MAYVYDGHFYDNEVDIPDLCSWECVNVEGGKREYWGMSADVSKLPTYSDLLTGSTALCLDTCDIYGYHAPTKAWYKL